jgi:hypothetical protein
MFSGNTISRIYTLYVAVLQPLVYTAGDEASEQGLKNKGRAPETLWRGESEALV